MREPRFDPFKARAVLLRDRQVIASRASDADFLRLAGEAARAAIGTVLLSGGGHECSRHSLALWDPFVTLRLEGAWARWRTTTGEVSMHGDPLAMLDRALAAPKPLYPLGSFPFAGGAAGYFAYELKDRIERLPRRARRDRRLPDAFLFWPRRMLIHDRAAGTVEELTLAWDGEETAELSAAGEASGQPPAAGAPICGTPRSNFTRAAYIGAVQRIRDYIRRGDVYQVNLSQRFASTFEGDPFRLFCSLFERNPAPFYAYVQAGDHQVISSSMERFLSLRDDTLESRPIKGTRRRGGTPEEDDALKAELAASAKDDAELSMIVDLIRNDLGKICRTGSVRVDRHKLMESYANVHHLVSVVTGKPLPGATPGDILRAMFPGGSITGCPKIRAMEIIDELEPHARHVYTGAIGYIGLHGTIDLNIAIRTAVVHRGACSFSVGGGVVYDSVPEEEYEETLHKGRTLFDLMGGDGGTR